MVLLRLTLLTLREGLRCVLCEGGSGEEEEEVATRGVCESEVCRCDETSMEGCGWTLREAD